ncbi:MAG: lysine 2,3-aminomutase, partial [Gammaproteobacteria bacterium]|nr:lysine 2,3-aminomutase [Gammaproteobacteria bacterium]
IDELIQWKGVPDDPLFQLTFPHRKMLPPRLYDRLKSVSDGSDSEASAQTVREIQQRLNPHWTDQRDQEFTQKEIVSERLQHSAREILFPFPGQRQACNDYRLFYDRNTQIDTHTGFTRHAAENLITNLRHHPQVTDLLFTGGDPLLMPSRILTTIIDTVLNADLPHLQIIRISTDVLRCWPYRFLTDNDAENLLTLLRRVLDSGRHLVLMTSFNHPRELETDAVKAAITHIRKTGATIWSQSPLLAGINDDPEIWSALWREQTRLGCLPHSLFLAQDTAAPCHFRLPLARAWTIFRDACRQVGEISLTV